MEQSDGGSMRKIKVGAWVPVGWPRRERGRTWHRSIGGLALPGRGRACDGGKMQQWEQKKRRWAQQLVVVMATAYRSAASRASRRIGGVRGTAAAAEAIGRRFDGMGGGGAPCLARCSSLAVLARSVNFFFASSSSAFQRVPISCTGGG